MHRQIKATEEQIKYAQLLDYGMKVGFLMLLVSFAIYVSGILPPAIPLPDVPKYWTLSVHDYLIATGTKAGWAWLSEVYKGDVLNFIGISFLAGVTILCYIRIIPILLRKQDRIYALLAALEVLVLLLAASGILRGGAH
jgi:hypothetical protein